MFTTKKIMVSMLTTIPLMGFAETNDDAQETMVITATMEPQKIQDVPAFSTVLTADDISKTSVSSVSDLLRETAGINNLTDSAGRDEIQIRGLGGEYTVLLVDGKRVDSEGAFDKGSDTDLNSVPMNAIERIEVIRGPMSVLYGADAIGGVMNIITKKPQQGAGWTGAIKTEARVIESGDGGNQYRSSVSAMGPLNEDMSLSVAAEDYRQKAWYADDDDVNPLREEKESQNVNTTLVWEATQNQTIDFDFGYNHDYRPYQIYSDDSDYRKQEITRFDFAVTHKGKWDWADTTAFVKYETSDIYDYNSVYDEPEHDGLEANNAYVKTYANKVIGSHSLLVGADFTNEQIKNNYSYSGSGEYNADQYGLFTQDEIALTEDLALTLGARVDNHDVYGTNISPKAYLVYTANDALTIKGGVTKAFKAPDASKLSEDYSVISCGGACYLSGNPDLEAETSISYELGFDYHSRNFSLSGSVFRNDIDNLIEREITYDDDGDPTSAEWVNVAKAMTQGVELSTTVYINSDLKLAANYTFLDTEAEDSDGEKTVLEGRAKHQVSTSVDYQVNDMIGTYLTVNYINGMEYSAWDSSASETAYYELPSYYRSDLGVNAYITDAFTVRAGVKNIGDVRLDEEDTGYTTYELGRNYFVSLEYLFGS